MIIAAVALTLAVAALLAFGSREVRPEIVPSGRLLSLAFGAALLMMNMQASLRTRLALGQNLATIADELDREIDAILAAFAGRPHIFNLGHGILQQTPIEHVERLLARVRD